MPDSSKRQRLTPNPSEQNRTAFDSNSRASDTAYHTSEEFPASSNADIMNDEEHQAATYLQRVSYSCVSYYNY